MNDPYSVLGVNANATDDQVKRAYRDLARKYHPDNYQNNPLADLAEEKMKEVNEAYDAVNKMRSGGGGGSYGGRSGGYGGGRGQSGGYASYNAGGYQQSGAHNFDSQRVRQLINSGNVSAAEQLLNAVNDRGAEWYFLMGTLSYRKGWMDEALQNFRKACTIEPNNPEYRRSLDYMERGGNAYSPFGGGAMVGGDTCDCCTTLLCLNCLCGGCG